nr:phospholipase D delta-like [Ipomoea trifida]
MEMDPGPPQLSRVGGLLKQASSAPLERSIGTSKRAVLLHGDLDLWVMAAKSLPNMDQVKGLAKFKDFDTSDPYVSVRVSGASIARTAVIRNCENPTWDEHFCLPIAHPIEKVEFHVKDNDGVGAEMIGSVEIPVEDILDGNEVSGWFPILGSSGGAVKAGAELHLSIEYRPVATNPIYKDGIGILKDSLGLPNTYFPMRRGGSITLYQDAHVPDEMLPDIPLDDGKVFKQKKCWEDICHAIVEAKHLIYVVGWSVYHRVKLVREPTRPLPSAGAKCLGDLLKYKSQEGVRVIVLVWDDKTSSHDFLVKTEGVMQTHDEETRKFFKHSSVNCVLCPRSPSNKLSIFKQKVVGNLFTHHQKCVILDTAAAGNCRKLTAFIGGLDLCDGRYDTPEHRILTDLDTIFVKDIHNPTFSDCSSGPRQPWHDLHCRIDGPAAFDVLTNFEQRYKKSSRRIYLNIKKVRHRSEDSLLNLKLIPHFKLPSVGPDGDDSVRVTSDEDPETWHVQVFRSIDSGSVKGFPKDVKEAEAKNLVCGKALRIDRSIHTAYVNAIRFAQHFVYIENQYFIGSSYNWSSHRYAGANNLVPMELAMNIASKIAAYEDFAVYIVIPMWPEGVTTSSAVQEILFWQYQTMSMMYKVVARALENAGLSERHPQDYLNFYCLGKREAADLGSHSEPSTPPQGRGLKLAQKFRRFMIYVHSKGMIVDDEYILMGSANINQRSLSGSRDTEIAMGAYQPHNTWANKQRLAQGQVYGYRMSLWAEHLGELEPCFQKPNSIKCVRRVNEIARYNWKAFVAANYHEMRGHLMQYPVQVSSAGEVTCLPGFECFPDVGGSILGSSTNLPDALTT